MPLTLVQTRTLKTIAANRSPESYLAGATVLHRDTNTPRYSQDIDLFHDLADSVAVCAEADAVTLRKAGYELAWSFYRAVVSVEEEQIGIEWAQDSALRFFPVQEDDQCGYRLHHADAAVNKVLALAGRQEVRDFVDVLHLNDTFLQLGALAWAACGKDPGYTPAGAGGTSRGLHSGGCGSPPSARSARGDGTEEEMVGGAGGGTGACRVAAPR